MNTKRCIDCIYCTSFYDSIENADIYSCEIPTHEIENPLTLHDCSDHESIHETIKQAENFKGTDLDEVIDNLFPGDLKATELIQHCPLCGASFEKIQKHNPHVLHRSTHKLLIKAHQNILPLCWECHLAYHEKRPINEKGPYYFERDIKPIMNNLWGENWLFALLLMEKTLKQDYKPRARAIKKYPIYPPTPEREDQIIIIWAFNKPMAYEAAQKLIGKGSTFAPQIVLSGDEPFIDVTC